MEDSWNSGDLERVASNYTIDSFWRSRVEFLSGRAFAVQKVGITGSGALLATVVATCVTIACTPVAGAASDRFGRKPLLGISVAGFLLLTYPAFILVTGVPSVALVALVQPGFGVLIAPYVGPLFSALAEMFPTRVRAAAVSPTYGVAGIIGAFAPAVATWLNAETGDINAPAFVVIGASILSGCALVVFRDRYREALSQVDAARSNVRRDLLFPRRSELDRTCFPNSVR